MMVYYKELTLEEGFKISMIEDRNQRLVGGREVSNCSGIMLFQHLHREGVPIKCWSCGVMADRWVTDRGQNDRGGRPVMNLYCVRPWPPTKKRSFAVQEVMLMTRDHIIPKVLGGVDDVQNLRPACSLCNGQRGHEMDEEDREFMRANPHLISEHRRLKGLKALEKNRLAKLAAEAKRQALKEAA